AKKTAWERRQTPYPSGLLYFKIRGRVVSLARLGRVFIFYNYTLPQILWDVNKHDFPKRHKVVCTLWKRDNRIAFVLANAIVSRIFPTTPFSAHAEFLRIVPVAFTTFRYANTPSNGSPGALLTFAIKLLCKAN
ncbi:MAG: hypothetical protein ABH814_02695, partial [bacterium]